MNNNVYPVETFTARRLIRMRSRADKAITRQAERIALDAMKSTHSHAYAIDKARRFLRQVTSHSYASPPPSAA